MPFALKLLLTNAVIITCSYLGRKYPALSGLVAAMPLTTLAVLFWLATDTPQDNRLLLEFTRGVFWGIGPTLLFFGALYYCLQRHLPLSVALLLSAVVWLAGAVVHQLVVR